MKKNIVRLSLAFVVIAVLLVPAVNAASETTKGWFPDFPLDKNPQYDYTVRLWILGPDMCNPTPPPYTFHELTPAEFGCLGEESSQHVSVLRYEPPNPTGATVWGLYHEELNFVLWLQKIPDSKQTPGEIAQVGETAKDMYNPTLTPAQNDAAGNIDWFRVDSTWYPRTLTKRVSWPGQSWSELWGPFDPDPSGSAFRERSYTVSHVPASFNNKKYLGVMVTIVGPSESDSDVIATEKYTFIHNIGWVERYFDLTTTSGEMQFKHIATLQDVSFPK